MKMLVIEDDTKTAAPRAGERVELQPREFRLLEFLLRGKLSRGGRDPELIHTVRGSGYVLRAPGA